MKKLKKVYVEITNVCNLSCAFCPGTLRKPGFMTPSDFETIVRRLKGHTDHLYFHVLGEPLLHPDLAELLEISASYGYKVNITTNGTRIADRAEVLLRAGSLRQVNFSLHCREEAGDYGLVDRYLDGIFDFTRAALAKTGIYISFRLWNINSKASERFNGYVAQRLQQSFSPDFSIAEAMKTASRITLEDRLFLNNAEVFSWPARAAAPGSEQSGFCLGLRDQAAVLVDGTVVPCCLDSEGTIKLGNIFGDELEYILSGERAKNLYEGFSKRKAVERLCINCSYRRRFS